MIKGFSKLPAQQKLQIAAGKCHDPKAAALLFESFRHPDQEIQKILAGISENTISNYPLPYNVAPNFLINGKEYMVPMVTEESSVVAAAASAARFWHERGGFNATVSGTVKNGHVHFLYKGDSKQLERVMPDMRVFLRKYVWRITKKMEERGGGIRDMVLDDRTNIMPHYFQMHVTFETKDAMGANFINSCLEELSAGIKAFLSDTPGFNTQDLELLMAILSNYNEQCLAQVKVSCSVDALEQAAAGLSAGEFARRFILAVNIAEADVYRATTHNKGIMNGVDAVIIATGNDFRAIEAGAHAYASRTGQYRSLSTATLHNNTFTFSLEMPMTVGTTGGLTRLHPLAARSLEILGDPNAETLMKIAAAAGLANNFAAIRSLTTTGIQSGHMQMHLSNIILQLNASQQEATEIQSHFSTKKVSYQAVADYLRELRNN